MGTKPYPKELRVEVVALARKRELSIRQIARDFGISEFTIYEWLKKADREDGVRVGEEPDTAELREARKRIRSLEQENEILRRAAAYFSQSSLPK